MDLFLVDIFVVLRIIPHCIDNMETGTQPNSISLYYRTDSIYVYVVLDYYIYIRFGQRDSSATSCSKLVSDYELNSNNNTNNNKKFTIFFYFLLLRSSLPIHKKKVICMYWNFENKLNILFLVP